MDIAPSCRGAVRGKLLLTKDARLASFDIGVLRRHGAVDEALKILKLSITALTPLRLFAVGVFK